MSIITLIDYGMGNIQSVVGGLEKAGAEIETAASGDAIGKAEAIVLPGVGAFESGMSNLKKRGIVRPLKDKISEGIPFLGICLGMQLLFGESEEHGTHEGLNIIPGSVIRFSRDLKVPHMGWNQVASAKQSPLFKDIDDGPYFYFVHSYYCVPDSKEDILGLTDYDVTFCSAVQRDNVFGTQFHPEKSQEIGLRLLINFVEYVNGQCTI